MKDESSSSAFTNEKFEVKWPLMKATRSRSPLPYCTKILFFGQAILLDNLINNILYRNYIKIDLDDTKRSKMKINNKKIDKFSLNQAV